MNLFYPDCADMVWHAWKEGDTYVRAFMEQILGHLAWSLGLVVNLIDPEVVTVSGYVLNNKPEWIDLISQKVIQWVIPVNGRTIKLQPSISTVEDELRVVACYDYCCELVGKRLAII